MKKCTKTETAMSVTNYTEPACVVMGSFNYFVKKGKAVKAKK